MSPIIVRVYGLVAMFVLLLSATATVASEKRINHSFLSTIWPPLTVFEVDIDKDGVGDFFRTREENKYITNSDKEWPIIIETWYLPDLDLEQWLHPPLRIETVTYDDATVGIGVSGKMIQKEKWVRAKTDKLSYKVNFQKHRSKISVQVFVIKNSQIVAIAK